MKREGSARKLATRASVSHFRHEAHEDSPDQQRMRGLFPVIATLARAFRIDQDIGDVLHVADFCRPFAHFQ